MPEGLERLLRDATFLTSTFGIALGWSLFQVAQGVGELVSTLLTPDQDLFAGATDSLPLTWDIGGRVLTLHALVIGLVELAVVALVAALVLRRRA